MNTVESTGFFQDAPRLRDEWSDDLALRRYLERSLPADVFADVEPSLAAMGHLAATELKDLADAIDTPEGEPVHTPFDAWGRRVDTVAPHHGWDRMAEVAAEHGVVATGYERAHGAHSRVHQFALAYLYGPSSALFSCPLAMTDGAAKTLLASGDRELIDRAVPHLTSRDPATFWTSGQWMTERTGGSDVGRSETVARFDGGVWRLHGTKWFTSAITSQMALTLARPEGNGSGGKGLAMFYVEVRDEVASGAGREDEERLNHLRVLRLKRKLGTRQLPTAELALDGTVAHLIGQPSDGTRNIAPMLTVTRLWNSVIAASGTRRGLALARDYARRRAAFGAHLIDQPLHQTTLAWLRVQHEATLQLAFRAVELLGRDEAGEATEAEQLTLRLLLPITKLLTAKQAVGAASEAIESFGGAGYVEDTHLPVLLRDAQVLPIWEGTTNVLSLDALRALRAEGVFTAYAEEVRRAARAGQDGELATLGKLAIDATDHASAWLLRALEAGAGAVEHGARRFALTLGRSLQLALLVQQAQHDLDAHGDGRAAAVARRFADEGIDLLEEPGSRTATDAALARDEALPAG